MLKRESFTYYIPIFVRCHSRSFFKYSGKMLRILKTKLVCNLAD